MNENGATTRRIFAPVFLNGVLEWLRDYPGGTKLSERFKSAFRVALAMVITYGISLSLDWDKAFWAALSVIFCSLATSGQSINASIDRIAGTAVSAVLALALIAIFPQERWLFLLSLSLVIAVCSYHLTANTPRKAIWFNAAFNLPIIALLGESGSSIAPATFSMAILRVQQTALGAIVYSLVAMLLWPRRGDEDFLETMRGIIRSQHRLFSGYIADILGKPPGTDLDQVLAGVAGKLPSLRAQMEGAAYDCSRLRLVSDAWIRHLDIVKRLHHTFERWHSGFEELAGLDLKRYLKNGDPYIGEIEARFADAEAMLSGEPVSREPSSMELLIDEQALRALSHVQRAALVSCFDYLEAIAGMTAALHKTAAQISSGKPAVPRARSVRSLLSTWVIDPDRFAGTLRQMAALWTIFLLIIYVEGIPIAVASVALTNAFGMVFIQMPYIKPSVMLKPVLQGALFAGAFYMLVMPHLSSFRELGGLLFLIIFGIAYLFHEPRTQLFRGMWMTMLVLIMGVDNQQMYSFLAFAQWFLVGVLFVLILIFTSRVPISFAPERQFPWQFRRFWRSAAFLLTDLSGVHDDGRSYRWMRGYHERQLAALPSRLKVWSKALHAAAGDDETRKRLAGLVNSMQLFSFRIQDLREALPHVMRLSHVSSLQSQGDETLSNLCRFTSALARNPETFDATSGRKILGQSECVLEQRVEEILQAGKLTREQALLVYRALGAYRGLLKAFDGFLIEMTRTDWRRISDERM